MGPAWGGRCVPFLGAALVLDAAGLALVLAGGVGKPTVAGCPLEDFLVLTGVLLLFLSLLCWLFWYSGNLRGLPAEELPAGVLPPDPPPAPRGSLGRLAAKLSERLSQRRRLPAAPPAAAAAASPSRSSPGPLELGHLPPAAHSPPGTPGGERLV